MLNSAFDLGGDCAGMLSLHQLSEALGNAVDARDPDTSRHSWEEAEVARILAESLGAAPPQVEKNHLAGHLHDIGKIGIPDAILKKPGRLDAQEWQLMREHPAIGAAIIRPVTVFSEAGGITEMIRHHHERFDGTGYPDRLSGEAIPFGARIIAVADTLSALLQHRPYRPGTGFTEATAEIIRCSGSQFDPLIVEALRESRLELQQLIETIKHNGLEDYFISSRLSAITSMPPTSPNRLSCPLP